MGNKIQINMLGCFEVIVDNERIDQKLSKSKKGWTLIKYLLLHQEAPVPSYELYAVLWPNDESSNPESALKTLISRMRSFLDSCSPDLGNCIATSRGSYRWNTEIDCKIDLVEFNELCKKVVGAKKLTKEVKSYFDKILSIYYGDLMPADAQESWAISHSVRLHNQYIKIVYSYLDFLKDEEEHDEIIRVCRAALEIDAFDERFHLELMDALVKTKRNNEALLQYRHATNLHFHYLGMQPPKGIQKFYHQLMQAGQELDMDIDRIRGELREYNEAKDAFVCDYDVFKEIYHLQMRNLERMGSTMFIALVMVSSVDGQPLDTLKLNEIMNRLLEVLRGNLRKGDTLTHYSAAQYAMLLPTVTYETGKMIMERIKSAFYRAYPNSSIMCSYRIGPIND